MSASFRDGEHGTPQGFYGHVYDKNNRPEIFFKGTGRVCVGPNQSIVDLVRIAETRSVEGVYDGICW